MIIMRTLGPSDSCYTHHLRNRGMNAEEVAKDQNHVNNYITATIIDLNGKKRTTGSKDSAEDVEARRNGVVLYRYA
ncbi:hypothetical protein scyTo_0006976 [Scyliorhinus torazame]|uniref:Uncharacterized protein n=1 Tax=Scyliorhinus torazame TaxID=75743 RepID=A0A401NJH6_SCYTO|nr:hypothetical protein [Scyliorhinus torazame]